MVRVKPAKEFFRDFLCQIVCTITDTSGRHPDRRYNAATTDLYFMRDINRLGSAALIKPNEWTDISGA